MKRVKRRVQRSVILSFGVLVHQFCTQRAGRNEEEPARDLAVHVTLRGARRSIVRILAVLVFFTDISYGNLTNRFYRNRALHLLTFCVADMTC